jgi:hypothetical protein
MVEKAGRTVRIDLSGTMEMKTGEIIKVEYFLPGKLEVIASLFRFYNENKFSAYSMSSYIGIMTGFFLRTGIWTPNTGCLNSLS